MMRTMGLRMARGLGMAFARTLVAFMVVLMFSSFWAYWHYIIRPHWQIALWICAVFGAWLVLALTLRYTVFRPKPMATFVDYSEDTNDYDD